MVRLLSFHLWRGERKSDGAASTSTEIIQHPPPSPAHVVVDVSDAEATGYLKTKYPLFVLSFEDLTYSVKEPKKNAIAAFLPGTAPADSPLPEAPPEKPRTKTLLASISGEAREGEILAVLGASGSGKSTLIDALANRISHESLRGTVALNGEPLKGRLLRAISAYVMQDDLLFPMLTVEETLMFAAEFRLPQSLPADKKRARVPALINKLGLRAAAGTIIGDEGHRGVSGGERRRVSIGIDIIHDPIILFLDEPTSGLDSTSAFRVVQVLKDIALSGSIVITTIHQPSFRILGLLDRLLFLSRGSIVYSGAPAGLQPYFTEFGHPIPENENRTEFALDLIRELESSPTGTKLLVDFNASRQLKKTTHLDKNSNNHTLPLIDAIAASISRGKLVSGAMDLTDNSHPAEMNTFANPFWTELRVLAKRSFTNTRRQPDLFAFRLATVLITGFILATVYWNLDTTPKGVQERLGFFAFAMSVMFYTCGDALPVFIHERYIFMRETSYNAYRRSSYVLANAVATFPALVILSLAFVATTFFSVGLAGGFDGFLFFFLIVLTSFCTGNSFVTFLSGVVSSVMVGFTVVIAVLAYYLLMSGFFITRDRIPSYWKWFHYLSLVKYPYEAVLHNEFDDASRCFVRGVQIFDNSPLGGTTEAVKLALLKGMSSTLGTNLTTSTCFVTGPDVLAQQGISSMSKWNCVLITLAWGFLFRALFYVALMLGGHNKRR